MQFHTVIQHQKALNRARQRLEVWQTELELIGIMGYQLVADKLTGVVSLQYFPDLDQRPEDERHEVIAETRRREFLIRKGRLDPDTGELIDREAA